MSDPVMRPMGNGVLLMQMNVASPMRPGDSRMSVVGRALHAGLSHVILKVMGSLHALLSHARSSGLRDRQDRQIRQLGHKVSEQCEDQHGWLGLLPIP